jgi:hypothetical protein
MAHTDCRHIEGTWAYKGSRLKYTAHIVAVPGKDRTQEVLDDIHVEIDPATMTERVAYYLSNKGEYQRLAMEIINGEVLTRYLIERPQPEK